MPRRVTLIGFLALVLVVPGVLVAATHSNPAVITIRDRVPSPASGGAVTINDSGSPPTTASPYPSTAEVIGGSGTITTMSVSLFGFNHAKPDDVDVLLVGPTGANIVLMSDSCGSTATGPINISFADGAAGILPDEGPCAGGAYKPFDWLDGIDTFPAPAPAPSTHMSLGLAFGGTDPNGTWSLYVVDDSAAGAGSFTSWSVNITTNGPAAPTAASPYPSNISVSGETPTPTGITVTLSGLAHTFFADIDVLLAGPTGVNLILMSDVCGNGELSARTFTFSDAAASAMTVVGPCPSGTYKPTNFFVDVFPAPAPAPSANTALSAFDGLDPNGTWSLYVVDDASSDSGKIGGGWSLTISGPTAVSVRALSARARPGSVTVSWSTGAETEITGFNVYRGNIRVNASLIHARASGTSAGRSYSLVDRNVRAGASYSYRLQVVKLDGSRVSAGSTSLTAR